MMTKKILVLLFVASLIAGFGGVRADEDVENQLNTYVVADPADRDSVRIVQRALAELGFDPGPADGLLGDQTRAALNAWQATSDVDVASGWLDVPQRSSSTGPGWRCTSVEEAEAHPGSSSTQRGDLISNIVVMMTFDGPEYMGSVDGESMHSIPAPPTHCPDGAVYDN